MMKCVDINAKDFVFLLIIVFFTASFEICYCNRSIHEGITMCPETERQALVSLKQSLEDPYSLFTSWNNEINCCKWKGVVCSNSTGHVHELHLGGYYDEDTSVAHGLSGKISSSLLNLKHLRYLDLSQNRFGERIPEFIGSLLNLEYLNLSNAGFFGTIPRTVGNLSNLHTLTLEAQHLSVYADNLDWLSGMFRLQHLNMNYVNLSKASDWLQAMNALPSLSELRLRGCELDSSALLVDQVNVSSLITIDLSRNHFTSRVLSRWISQLNDLVFLDLSRNSIEGPIPNVSSTTKLEHVDLSYNRFSTIPEWLYSCNNLEFVSLEYNNLQGVISDAIANLSSLRSLDLSKNNLSGNVPTEIWRSCKMQTLGLSFNQLQGDLLDFSGNMSDCFLRSVTSLSLQWNRFSGYIPPRFGNFTNLRLLDLSYNSLSGTIPVELGKLSSLEFLSLSNNKLTGNFPKTLSNLFNLRWLSTAYNSLEGVVSENHLINLNNLFFFDASENDLTFEVSPDWIPPFKLTSLYLQSVNLSGQFPQWLENQKGIEDLDLSSTGISGNVPNWVWDIPWLNLSHNNLHGNVPDMTIGNDYFFQIKCLSSNQFSGPLPRVASNVGELDLSDNSFFGDLSDVICDDMNGNYSLRILNLGGNRFTGKLPDCWMKLPDLEALDLGDNNMHGSVPTSIGLLSNLVTLNLRNNRFSGHIPSSILNSATVMKIDLSGNRFRGNLPTWTSRNSDSLQFLILRSNRLSGRIDRGICLLTSLQLLDISNNSLHGTIPNCIYNLTAMASKKKIQPFLVYEYPRTYGSYDDSVIIMTKGIERQYDIILPLVISMDLSNNNLSGSIPRELTRLVELRLLNLSRNRLTGSIPTEMGDMSQLESVDLSLNSLTGEIPPSFAIMTSLSCLNVSYNKLTGRIPESTQLQSMNASSFIGNRLCGPPLTTSTDQCGNEGDAIVLLHKSDRKGVEVDWFVVLLSLGFVVGLSSACTVIIFKKEAYFMLLDDVLCGIGAVCVR